MIGDPVGDAVKWLREEGLLGYPTETVWGLGADARSERAIAKLSRWKGRDAASPISLLVTGLESLEALGCRVDAAARRLAEAFWPGPLTLVLPCSGRFAGGVAREDGALGVRCSSHPLARLLARRLEAQGVGPVTATSLNRRGAPPAKTRAEAEAACGDGPGAPRLVGVEGAESGGDRASTVVDLCGARPEVLRWGALEASALEPLLRAIGGA